MEYGPRIYLSVTPFHMTVRERKIVHCARGPAVTKKYRLDSAHIDTHQLMFA